MKTIFFSALAVLTLLTGCLWAPYRETVYFDIVPRENTAAQGVTFDITDLRNDSGSGSRFQYRNADGRISADPDRKWVMPPGALVARAIRLALTPVPAENKGISIQSSDPATAVRVSGDLLVFETDLAAKTFCVHARLRVRTPRNKVQLLDCNIRIPMQDTTPGSITLAGGKAVEEIVNQLKKVR